MSHNSLTDKPRNPCMIASANGLDRRGVYAGGPQGQGQLSGRKRALLCGCNYAGSSAALNGAS